MTDIVNEIDQVKSITLVIKEIENMSLNMDLDDEEIQDSIAKLKKFTNNYYLKLISNK